MLATLRDVFNDVCRVGADAGEHRGRLGIQPAQSDGVEPRVLGDPAQVSWVSPLVEERQVDPAEVQAVTSGPDDAWLSRRCPGRAR